MSADVLDQPRRTGTYVVGDELAVQLVYLVAGIEQGLKKHEITNLMLGSDAPHPLVADSGHIGMVMNQVFKAELITRYIAGRYRGWQFPGVFEYEVTEPLGVWIAENPEASIADFTAQLESSSRAFFNPDRK